MKTDHTAQITALVARVADVQPEALARVENELRRSFGGQKVQILRQAPITIDRINERLYQGKPVREIASDFRVSRATIYRELQRNSRKSRKP